MTIFHRLELFVKRLFVKITGRKPSYIRTGRCKKCGRCCRDIGLLLDSVKISSDEELLQLISQETIYNIFVKCGESCDGSYIFTCSKITDGNTCSIYSSRPEVCRDYPDLNLMRMGTELHKNCGFMLFPPKDFESYL